MGREIWTVGHSNRDLATFVGLLQAAAIERVADVRRSPGSKRHPHFDREALEASLAGEGIGYRHFEGLGGRRGRRREGSPNVGWRVEPFNAFADFMDTPEFASDLDELMKFAVPGRTVILCSEVLPWRCHRRLIADALIIRGWTVRDIIGPGPSRPHPLTSFAQVDGTRLTYPEEPEGTRGAVIVSGPTE